MDADTPTASRLRFGSFDFDPGARELRSGGTTVRLQEQPCAILRLLLERRGQVVTRDELRDTLWPAGTFVDFEHSLNAAVKRLRAALGDDADNPRFIETIPRRGYRFVRDAEDAEALAADRHHRVRLAVLPFVELGGDAPQDFFSLGFTEEMISQLGRRCGDRLGVISSHSSNAFAQTTARARDIGLALRADYLLEGSIRRGGGRLRVTARLVETASETHLWVDTIEEPLTDWLAAQTGIAARIARSLAMELVPDRVVAPAGARDPGAYQSYLKGRYHWQRLADTGAREALRNFEEAAERDPSFAGAHAGVALLEVMRASYYHTVPRLALERARAAAERALRLDPALSEAHVAAGEVARYLHADPRSARAAYRRAIELNPSLETARTAHARLLASLGRFASAIREADVARELDPRCLTANSVAAWIRYVVGDYDAAEAVARDTLELNERHLGARLLLGAALLAAGRRNEALRVLDEAAHLPDASPIALAVLAHARASTGDRGAAIELVAALERASCDRYVSPAYVALAHAGLGDLTAAFTALDSACRDGDPVASHAAIDPRFAPLRSDPRYPALLRRLGLFEFHAPGGRPAPVAGALAEGGSAA